MIKDDYSLIGYASGVAGADSRVSGGPLKMQHSRYLAPALSEGVHFNWEAMIKAPQNVTEVEKEVSQLLQRLAADVSTSLKAGQLVSVIGGDHSSAIGTWSGVYDAYHEQGDLGLIWIDAHMDSHTPETSETGNIHGMPLACLLGHGSTTFTQLLHAKPKLLPKNTCLVGIRSFEKGEEALLKRLQVRVFHMDEIKARGLQAVMEEAVAIVTARTIGYGISLDIDSIDPTDAPGVDVPEPNGIRYQDLYASLKKIAIDPRLVATEIVEFDPDKDVEEKTEKIVAEIMLLFARGQLRAKASTASMTYSANNR